MRLGSLARGTVIYGLGEVSSRVITFILLPVFTAYLSPADYGVISILGALAIFLTPVFSLGIGGGIAPIYFDGNDRARKQHTINTSFVLVSASAAVLLAIGWPGARAISGVLFQTGEFAGLVRISLLTTALTVVAIPLRQFLQFEERARVYVALSVASIVTSSVLSVVLVVVFKRGVRGMLEAGLIGQAATAVLFAAPCLSWLRPRTGREIARELLKLSLPLVPAFGCMFLLQHGGKYLLQWLDGLGDVGIYTVGMNIGLVVSLVVTAFQSAWIPYFMSFADKPDEAKVVFGRVLTYYVLAIGTVALALFAVAHPLVLVMTRASFHPAWRVVGLSATAQMLAGAATIMLPGMYIAKEVQFIGLIQGVAGAAGVALNIVLIRAFGVVGAALALVVTYVLLAALQLAWNRRRGYLAVAYEWRRLARFAALYAAFAIVAAWDRDLSLAAEIGLSALLLVAAFVLGYSQLTRFERFRLRDLVRTFLRAAPLEQPARA